MNLCEDFLRNVPSSYCRLICHYNDRQTAFVQETYGFRRARQESNLIRSANVIRAIFDDDPITVEKNCAFALKSHRATSGHWEYIFGGQEA
jgi:hypothetical protein